MDITINVLARQGDAVIGVAVRGGVRVGAWLGQHVREGGEDNAQNHKDEKENSSRDDPAADLGIHLKRMRRVGEGQCRRVKHPLLSRYTPK